jgi:hypothetical protein
VTREFENGLVQLENGTVHNPANLILEVDRPGQEHVVVHFSNGAKRAEIRRHYEDGSVVTVDGSLIPKSLWSASVASPSVNRSALVCLSNGECRFEKITKAFADGSVSTESHTRLEASQYVMEVPHHPLVGHRVGVNEQNKLFEITPKAVLSDGRIITADNKIFTVKQFLPLGKNAPEGKEFFREVNGKYQIGKTAVTFDDDLIITEKNEFLPKGSYFRVTSTERREKRILTKSAEVWSSEVMWAEVDGNRIVTKSGRLVPLQDCAFPIEGADAIGQEVQVPGTNRSERITDILPDGTAILSGGSRVAKSAVTAAIAQAKVRTSMPIQGTADATNADSALAAPSDTVALRCAESFL